VVVCGETREAAKNETILGLRYLSHSAKHTTNTNVIIMCVPHRYDLQSFSCVNNEVVSFNRKLQKLMKAYGHILTCSMTNKREHYTTHEFHMNALGKNWITNVLAKVIKSLFTSSLIKPAVPLPWNSDKSDDKCLVTVDNCPANSMQNCPSRKEQDSNKEWKVTQSTESKLQNLCNKAVCSPIFNHHLLRKKKLATRNEYFLVLSTVIKCENKTEYT
jgi:hypothetical protein